MDELRDFRKLFREEEAWMDSQSNAKAMLFESDRESRFSRNPADRDFS